MSSSCSQRHVTEDKLRAHAMLLLSSAREWKLPDASSLLGGPLARGSAHGFSSDSPCASTRRPLGSALYQAGSSIVLLSTVRSPLWWSGMAVGVGSARGLPLAGHRVPPPVGGAGGSTAWLTAAARAAQPHSYAATWGQKESQRKQGEYQRVASSTLLQVWSTLL